MEHVQYFVHYFGLDGLFSKDTLVSAAYFTYYYCMFN